MKEEQRSNGEGYRDPTADAAVTRADKKKKNLTLYMNGKRIGKVAEASFELDSEEEKRIRKKAKTKEPISGTLTLKLEGKETLGLIIGIKVTNNWLKMHGGIITRKLRRRKRG